MPGSRRTNWQTKSTPELGKDTTILPKITETPTLKHKEDHEAHEPHLPRVIMYPLSKSAKDQREETPVPPQTDDELVFNGRSVLLQNGLGVNYSDDGQADEIDLRI